METISNRKTQLLNEIEYLKQRYYKDTDNVLDAKSCDCWYNIETVLRHCDDSALEWEVIQHNRLKEKTDKYFI